MGVARTIAKNTGFRFLATVSDIGINLLIGIVLARGLGPEQYGLYSLLIWFIGLGTLFIRFGLGDMAKRFISEAAGQRNWDVQKGIVQLTLVLRVIAIVVIFLVMLLFSRSWASLFQDASNQYYFVLIAFAFLPSVINLSLTAIFAGFQRYDYGAYVILITNPLRAIAIITFMALNFGLQEVILVNAAAWALGILIGVFLLQRLVPFRELFSSTHLQPAVRKRALKYAITMTGILAINYIIWHQSEVFFLGLYCPVEQVGFYTLAVKIPGMIMLLIPTVLGSVLLPTITEQFGRGDMEKLKGIFVTSARYLMMLALPLATAGMALAAPIVHLLYGPDYEPVIVLLQILFIPFAMMGISHAATSVIYAINKPSFVLKTGLVLAVFHIGLNFWLIPIYGVLGAAIGSSIPRLLIIPFYIWYASRKIGAPWPLRDTIKIVLASSIAGLALFVLQSHLGTVLCLLLSLPIGLGLYGIAILALRIIRPQDLDILREVQSLVPSPLRRHYMTLVHMLERTVSTKPPR